MSPELLTALAQCGPAGLIGLLWIVERRHANRREIQLHEAHRKLVAQDQSIQNLLDVLRENTRAITMLEQTQRQLVEVVQRLTGRTERVKS
jgi:hypothetical protein